MLILAAGVMIWCLGHLLPSVAPGLRAQLVGWLGEKRYRLLFALDMAIALVLIVWGYGSAEFVQIYDPPQWGRHLNNLLMLIAVYLFAVGGAKGWFAAKFRHPMLLGVLIWAVAHLLANGDQASLLLFGAMGLWAVAEMVAINRRTPDWTPPAPAGVAAEVKLALITLVAFAVLAFIHGWVLGVHPFPG